MGTTTPVFESSDVTIWNADARDAASLLAPASVDAIVTSPPYFGLRDYGHDGQVGLEPFPDEYVQGMADLLTSYVDVLKPEGSLWLNLGDTYSTGAGNPGQGLEAWGERHGTGGGHKIKDATISRPRIAGVPSKCLLMIPERVAMALIERGWILRNRVVWAKPNGMPSSVQDRLATKHEAMFHFVRQPVYHYDLDAIREPHQVGKASGRPSDAAPSTSPYRRNQVHAGNGANIGLHPGGKNPGDVWAIATQPYPEAHFAVFPPELVRRPILATVPEGGTVLDPFFGSGTTAVMARKLGRKTVGIELNPEYCALAAARFQQEVLPLDASA